MIFGLTFDDITGELQNNELQFCFEIHIHTEKSVGLRLTSVNSAPESEIRRYWP